MTTTDLPAGPELDALVAEKVMGWKPVHYKYFTRWESKDGRSVTTGTNYSKINPALNWCPHVDIAAAWKVHQEIQKHRFSVRWKYYHALQVAVHERLGHDVMVGWPDAFGLIEPVDICRAALSAVEEKICPASH